MCQYHVISVWEHEVPGCASGNQGPQTVGSTILLQAAIHRGGISNTLHQYDHCTALQNQKLVSAYLSSKQMMHLALHGSLIT